MHIPDGMLSTPTLAASALGSAGVVAYAVRRVRDAADDSRLVLMAVMSALVFALQMLNFPVAGGTSGHFAGGAAAAIILGLWPAVIIMTAVVVVQALVFADGGITALGANVLDLAIVGPIVGWWVHSALLGVIGEGRTRRTAAAFTAAWAATVTAALSAGALLALSGRMPVAIALGAMGLWHALIGVGEGAITAGLVGYLLSVRPDLVATPDSAANRRTVISLGVLSVAAVALSFLASTNPDGLEFVYERFGAPVTTDSAANGLIPDYVIPGIANETLAGALAGIVGVVLVGVLVAALVSGLRRSRGSDAD